jgi:hypothetical protein
MTVEAADVFGELFWGMGGRKRDRQKTGTSGRENGTGNYFVIELTKRLFRNILKVVKKWETVWA